MRFVTNFAEANGNHSIIKVKKTGDVNDIIRLTPDIIQPRPPLMLIIIY